MKTFYLAGRLFQLMGLMAMPYSMWIAHFERDERASISVFVASIVVLGVTISSAIVG